MLGAAPTGSSALHVQQDLSARVPLEKETLQLHSESLSGS